MSFESPRFFRVGRTTLYGLYLFTEFGAHPAAAGLETLVHMVAEGRLRPRVEREGSWTDVGALARELLERRYVGKAVLRVD